MRAERITFDEVGLRWPSWKDALWAIGLALVSLVVSSALQLLFPLAGPSLANTIGSINVLVAISFVLIVAFAEELTFRGYLIGVFSSNIGRAAAFFLSTCVFGLAHARTFGFNGTLLAPLVVGALFAGFYVWRRNLTACVMGHALIDYLGVMLISSAHAP